jgi:hypothetical protein
LIGTASKEQAGNNFPDSKLQDAEKKSKSFNRQDAKSAKARKREKRGEGESAGQPSPNIKVYLI